MPTIDLWGVPHRYDWFPTAAPSSAPVLVYLMVGSWGGDIGNP
ncbi:MAG: hypothetical protein ACKO5Q_21430 [Microcystaceae cyanobacterium]